MDDTRRLRFSLFLQAFACVMFLGAGLVRGVAVGFDAFSWILLGGSLLAGGLFVVSRRLLMGS